MRTLLILLEHAHDAPRDVTFLLVRRPDKGLLASLWQFVEADISDLEGGTEADRVRIVKARVAGLFAPDALEDAHMRWPALTCVGDFTHLFTHIRQTVHVYWMPVRACEDRVQG